MSAIFCNSDEQSLRGLYRPTNDDGRPKAETQRLLQVSKPLCMRKVLRPRSEVSGRRKSCFDIKVPAKANFRFGSISTESDPSGYVRFTLGSARNADIPVRQLCAATTDTRLRKVD